MALKFVKPEKTTKIDFLDDSKIIIERLSSTKVQQLRQEAKEKYSLTDSAEIFEFVLKHYIKGWENIEDGETGKPLGVTNEVRDNIFTMVMNNKDALNKLIAFVNGPAKN